MTGFGGEETKSKGFVDHEIQVDDVKLTDYFHVDSGMQCDTLLCVDAISECDLAVTKEGVKFKKSRQD